MVDSTKDEKLTGGSGHFSRQFHLPTIVIIVYGDLWTLTLFGPAYSAITWLVQLISWNAY
jgi:hypothetical protein